MGWGAAGGIGGGSRLVARGMVSSSFVRPSKESAKVSGDTVPPSSELLRSRLRLRVRLLFRLWGVMSRPGKTSIRQWGHRIFNRSHALMHCKWKM